MSTKLVTYQARLSLTASLARVRDVVGTVEHIGGRVEFLPMKAEGITTVRLHLPSPHTPERFLPGLPFYPV